MNCPLTCLQLLLKHLLILWHQKVSQRLFKHVRRLTPQQTSHSLVNKRHRASLVVTRHELAIRAIDQIVGRARHLNARDRDQMKVGGRRIAVLVHAMVHARLALVLVN